jgi:hypothetical protein
MDDSPDERSGILILRAWTDGRKPRRLRARITQVVDGHELPRASTASVDAACAIVGAWLTDLLESDGARPEASRDDR